MKPHHALLLFYAVLWTGCSRSNNLVLGRVEATVGTHNVVVTDCYRTSVPPPEKVGEADYRFTPCRDADVLIRKEELVVNGRSYGYLKPNDAVLVDHGVVSINPPA
ncbi:MAG TPA: hypothetical protein VMG58_18020 [Candidatus Sulfotelmatobacter sp.]|nr:hypothetical protein [Candidatus Sulfotelmatobacter sp.]